MKITALLENTVERNDVKAEHGLSLFIEAEGEKILFDMGQTELFSDNAQRLGIDLDSVDYAVLSHGHYDHGGGLGRFLKINNHAPIYINENAFMPYYNGTEKYIGLDPCYKDHPQIIYTSDSYKISDHASLFTCNDKKRHYPVIFSGLNKKTDRGFVPDDFGHEQYLLLKEGDKRILISGCSHKGIMDITKWFSPHVLIGGFHFSKLPLDDFFISYAKELSSYDTLYYTCHCTGKEQFDFMKKYMPRLNYLSCGQTITI